MVIYLWELRKATYVRYLRLQIGLMLTTQLRYYLIPQVRCYTDWFRISTFSILLGSVIGSTTVNEFTESEMTQTVSMTNGVLAVIMYIQAIYI